MRVIPFFCLLLSACTTNEQESNASLLKHNLDVQQIATISFRRLSLETDPLLAQTVTYEPEALVPQEQLKKQNSEQSEAPNSSKSTGPFRVINEKTVGSSNSTSVYIESKSNVPLYVSSIIAALGIFLNAIVFAYARKDKNRDHNKGVIDEFWYRTILMPELKQHAKAFVKDNLDFWTEVKSKPVYSLSRSQKFIEDRFNVHNHKVLMTVENIKMIDAGFNRGEEVQSLFETLEDKVVDAAYSMIDDNFHQRLVKMNEIIDSVNELEPKLTSILLTQHREFSGIKSQTTMFANFKSKLTKLFQS